MGKKITVATVCMLLCVVACMAQDTAVYFKFASRAGRSQFVQNVTANTIMKGLDTPLTDSTEADWQGSFWAMELLRYKTTRVKEKISAAFKDIDNRSTGFQRALLELCYANYPFAFKTDITGLKQRTTDAKIFAMCCEYLYRIAEQSPATNKPLAVYLKKEIDAKFAGQQEHPILKMLLAGRIATGYTAVKKILPVLLSKSFLPGKRVVYSLQRKNRDYPGIAIVRDSSGNFIKNNTGSVFYVPQLARSITNLPAYLTNGNTPQGIFRMQGFAVSSSNFIGPTPNIQLAMPYETTVPHFLADSSIADTTWTTGVYQQLLPASCRSYFALMGTYYASQAGRTETIAHGTTIDPAYYKGASYWPHTPTLGCLCTREIWDAKGKRTESNQQLLVDAIIKAGGADGYLIMLELDDKQMPVDIKEIAKRRPIFKKAKAASFSMPFF
jgi:hypothetical protein